MINERTEEMLKMRQEGKSHAEIAEKHGISKQRVVELLRPFKLSKRYILEEPET